MGGRHPVNKIPFEHRRVASDDPASLFGGEVFRVWKRTEEILDRAVYVALEWSCARLFGSRRTERLPGFRGHGSLLGKWSLPTTCRTNQRGGCTSRANPRITAKSTFTRSGRG